ncbi:MAG: RsmE family RNA methyltransferase [Planctomycetia bacterium]|nr:RsmE family RNA methyltransferase [Planctomycetia bacterium]
MSEHYYLSQVPDPESTTAILTGQDAIHLARVMRAVPGDEVFLFDGTGADYRCIIQNIQKDRVETTILEKRCPEQGPSLDLTMAVALPKGERQKWLIEKLTELGVARYIPLRTARGDVKYDENVRDRLRRQAIEASKQCGRLRIMEIMPEMSRREIMAPHLGLVQEDTVTILAHPKSDGEFGQWSFPRFAERFRVEGVPKRIVLAVGPVGGLTQEEVQEAVDDHWPTLDLGDMVYRVETAAIVAASLFLHLQ